MEVDFAMKGVTLESFRLEELEAIRGALIDEKLALEGDSSASYLVTL